MNDHTRRAIAFIAVGLASGKQRAAVYDYDLRCYFNFSGTVEERNVSVYDYDERCYVSGSAKSLYHYGDRAYVNLEMRTDKKADGYDYETRSHFSADISNDSVTIYDYGDHAYHNYSVS